MPVRKKTSRDQSGITQRDVDLLRKAIKDGYPWICHESDMFVPSPVDDRLEIMLSYATGIFTLSVGYEPDAHPAPATVKFLKKVLADVLHAAEKKWSHLKIERWSAKDLRQRSPSQGPRPLY